ncbi:hypothetical protein BCR43DRAFT_489433 [Syncephalastrum racemosum]|uniref:Secreted protein n=1 Tax=Syncephalastrum racemosum TaxID=13706 RepID=A0A1X2HE89_SYNRA|nr:hypothetical protein BCR43DRAFT_489433 [Syncephalastrum racemosum]
MCVCAILPCLTARCAMFCCSLSAAPSQILAVCLRLRISRLSVSVRRPPPSFSVPFYLFFWPLSLSVSLSPSMLSLLLGIATKK